MKERKGPSGWLIRIFSIAWLGLIAIASWELLGRASGTGNGRVLGLFSARWALGFGLYSLGIAPLAALGGWGLFRPDQLVRKGLVRLEAVIAKLGILRWLLLLCAVIFPSLFLLGPWGWRFEIPAFRLFLAVAAGILAGFAIPTTKGTRSARLVFGILLTTTLFILVRLLMTVSDFPFSLSWSEGNRLWDYSLYFGRDRYTLADEFSYPSYLTPGRHGLWGLPFLFFPGISIAGMRLWDVVLWTVPYFLLGAALFSSQESPLPPLWRWAFVFWTFLFLSQGPIYAPLILSAAFWVWGYRRGKPIRSLAVTASAAFYAGISRWTWMFAPAIWAGLWAFLEGEHADFRKRLKWPFMVMSSGLAGGLLSLLVMNLAFPRPDPIYATSLSHELLWYRLWKSSTNPIGIIPGLILSVGPILLWLVWEVLHRRVRWDGLDLLALGGALAAFFGAGLIASVKIGGGSNLHNLDMFLAGLVLIVGMRLRKKDQMERIPALGVILLSILILMPVWPAIRSGGPEKVPSRAEVLPALETLQARIAESARKGEVLFMDQRQLLTFGEITGVPLVMDYELKHVMNQALGNNEAYLRTFYQDLEAHRFQMIVSDPLHVVYKKGEGPFPEENDAFVNQVTIPILAHYQPTLKLDEYEIWLLTPKGN